MRRRFGVGLLVLGMFTCDGRQPSLSQGLLAAISEPGLAIGTFHRTSAVAAAAATPAPIGFVFDAKQGVFTYGHGSTSLDYEATLDARTGGLYVKRTDAQGGLRLRPSGGSLDFADWGPGLQKGESVVHSAETGEAAAVHTASKTGVKEDIVVAAPIGDLADFEWNLTLDPGLEARADGHGNIDIYGPSNFLWGDIQIGDDHSRQLIEQARQNAKKDQLLYRLPKPVVRQTSGCIAANVATLELDGSRLRLIAARLSQLAYPISIDPSVIIDTTGEFGLGGNLETDADLGSGQIQRGGIKAGAGTWSATVTVPTARADHTSVAYNGYLYVIGGNSGSTQYGDVEIAPINANGTIGAWTATTALTTARSNHASVAYNGYLYVIGGNTGSADLNDVEVAAISANGTIGTWSATTPLSSARDQHTSVAYNGYLYVLGGVNGSTFYNDVEAAPIHGDGTIGSWSATSSFPTPRSAHTSVAYDGHLYVLGGFAGGSTELSDVEVAPINTNGTVGTWVATTSIPTVRFAHTSVAYDGYLYVIGGFTLAGWNDVEVAPIYANGTLGTWIASTTLSTARYGHSSVAYNGNLYVIGGYSGSVYLKDVEVAPVNQNGNLGTWSATTSFPSGMTARRAFGSAAYDGYLYVLAGIEGSSPGTDTWYTPINSDGTVGTWTSTSSFTSARYRFPSVAYNGYLYLLGGDNGTTTFNDVQYAAIKGTGVLSAWASTSSFATGRQFPTSVAYNGYLYLLGGQNGSTYYNDVQYAPINPNGTVGAWQSTTAFTTGRAAQCSAVYNGYLYILGGTDSGGTLNDVQYAPINASGTVGTWSATTAFPTATSEFGCAAYNGYLYITGMGGASASSTEMAPINANGTLGSWSAVVNSYATGRYGQATFAYNGNLYVIAGATSSANLSDVQYAPIVSNGPLGTWSATTAIPTARARHTSVAYNGYLYVIGGLNSSTYYDDVEVAPINSTGTVGTWSATTALATARLGHTTVEYNGYLYVIGGQSSSNALDDVEVAPISTNGTVGTWSATTVIPTARVYHTSVAYNGYLYVIGGTPGSGELNDVEVAPINSNGTVGTWSATNAFPTARHLHASVAYNGYLYVIGGNDGTNYRDDVQVAPINSNGTVGTWTPTTAFPGAAREGHTSVAYNGYLYVIGGYNGTSLGFSDVLAAPINANGTLGAWTWTDALATARVYHTTVEYNGDLYVIAGQDSTPTFFSDVQVSTLETPAALGYYSKLVDLGSVVASVDTVTVSGLSTNLGQVHLQYQVAPGSAVFGAVEVPPASVNGYIPLGTSVALGDANVRYVWFRLTLDDTNAALINPDATNERDVNNVTIAYTLPVSVSPTTASVAPRGSQTFTGAGGTGTYAWSINPNNSGGTITAGGNYTAGTTGSVIDTVVCTDTKNNVGTATVTVGPGITISPASATLAPKGSKTFSATGGSGTFTWSMQSAPSGGTINASTGAYVAGSTGSVTDVVLVTDSLGNIQTANVTVTAGITISPASTTLAPKASKTFSASGGSGAGFTWSMKSAPSGGTINSSSGAYTAGTTGSVTDVVQVTDSLGNTQTASVTVTAGVTISPPSASLAPRGTQTFTASGGSGTGFSWSMQSAPSGGTINAASGAYKAGSTGSVTDVVQVTDSLGNTQTANVTVSAGISINPGSASVAVSGMQTFTATGGSGSGYVWSMQSAPSGGSISSSGLYTAGTNGSVTDVVLVTDSLGNTQTANVSVGSTLVITPASATVAPKGPQSFSGMGGSGSGFTWSLSTNNSGGSITSSGGNYTAGPTGSVTDIVKLTDSLNNTQFASVTVTASVSISPLSANLAPKAMQGFSATGGSNNGFTWSLSTNNSGGSISSMGAYTAGATGSVTDVVQVTDSLGNTKTATVTVGAAIMINPGSASVAPRGQQGFAATGGSGIGFTWSFATNASGGTIGSTTGAYTAGAIGSVTDVVQVTDSLGNTKTASVTVGPAITISPVSASVAPKGSQTFTASGGNGAPYTWSMQSAPSGGTIIGSTGAYTAGTTGSVTDVVQVTDSLGNVKTASVTVGAAISITPSSSAVAPKGSQTFSAQGGSGTGFSWSLATNASGGTINAASGVYTAGPTGSVTDVVEVTDSLGNTKTANVTVSAAISLSPASATVAPKGSQPFAAAGGAGSPYTWSVSMNKSGASITSMGVYTAGTTGSVTDVVQVTDSLGNVQTANVTVTAGITITPPTASTPPKGSVNFGAVGGSGSPYTWSLSTNGSIGSINSMGDYTAGASGSVNDVVQATDSLGNIQTANVTVTAGVSISPATASVATGMMQDFTANGGSGVGYVWSMQANPSGGSITSSGVYTAGTTGPTTDVVKLVDSLGNSATANVSVGSTLVIMPSSATVAPKGTQQFTGSGGSGSGFTWTLSTNASGGSIGMTSGAYTAGSTGSVADVVKLTDSLNNTQYASVTVTAGVGISPVSPATSPKGSISFNASGGSGGPYTWSLATNNSGGTIGMTTGAYVAGSIGSVTDVVQVSDSQGNTRTTNVTVTPAVTISPASATIAPMGMQTFGATGGSGTGFTWSMQVAPSGGTIGPTTGAYVAGSNGGVTDVVLVTDSLGNTKAANVTVTGSVAITPAAPSVSPKATISFSAMGGSGTGYTWKLTTDASAGSIIAATGQYTAGATGSVTDTIQVTDSAGNTATASIAVGPSVTITPASASLSPRGSQTFTASGGSGAGFSWVVTTNKSGGSIVGTGDTGAYAAGTTGSVTDVIEVTDSLGNTATADVAVTAGLSVNPPSASVPPLGTQSFTCVGGSGSLLAFVLTTNKSGGSITPQGSYTAGSTGLVSDVATCTDSLGNAQNVSITVGPGLSVTPASPTSPPSGTINFSASGGAGSGFAWSISTNASGGSIVATSGVYTAGTTGSVTDVVQVKDSLGNVTNVNVSVTAAVSITPASASLPTKGTQNFTAGGGSGTGYVWTLATNASGGSIVAATGAYTAGSTSNTVDRVQVKDSLGNTATASVSVGSTVAIMPPNATVPPKGPQMFSASGGSGSGYLWSLSSNPSGGTINSSGAYTAGTTGLVTDVVQLQDSLGNLQFASVTVTAGVSVSPAQVTVAPGGSQSFTATGGSGTGFVWSLPTNASGGTITPAGIYTAGTTGSVIDVVQAKDSLGNLKTATVTVAAGVAISPAAPTTPPHGPTITFTASGGKPPYTWSVVTMPLPSGGTFVTATAVYSPGPKGGVIDTLAVTDADGVTAQVSIMVTAGISIMPPSAGVVPHGTQTFAAMGGSNTGFTWSMQMAPSGGSINPSGISSAVYTAGAMGSVTDVVQVTDSLGNVQTASVTVGSAVSVSPSIVTVPPKGIQDFTASGGSGTGYTWSMQTDHSGGQIAPTGAMTATYTAGPTGSVSDVVQVVDSMGGSAMATVNVGPGVSIAPPTACVAPQGTVDFKASGGSDTGFAWTLLVNSSGATLDAGSTSALYAAGTTSGTDVVQVTDSINNVKAAVVMVGFCSAPDAGTSDAGSPDAAVPDGSAADAGRVDGSIGDGGERLDAGSGDAGTEDAGIGDAGINPVPFRGLSCSCNSTASNWPMLAMGAGILLRRRRRRSPRA
jgi:large repetitive protein